MKKYELKFIDDGEEISMNETSNDFNHLEIIGLLSMRIAEIQKEVLNMPPSTIREDLK